MCLIRYRLSRDIKDEDEKYSDDEYEDGGGVSSSPARKSAVALDHAAAGQAGSGSTAQRRDDNGGVSHRSQETHAPGRNGHSQRERHETAGAAPRAALVGATPAGAGSASMDAALRAPSHLPSSPRPLPALPKGSAHGRNLLKLAQRLFFFNSYWLKTL
jgi:hypothetical protein